MDQSTTEKAKAGLGSVLFAFSLWLFDKGWDLMLTPEGIVYGFSGVTLWVASIVLWLLSIVLVWPWISENLFPWLKHGFIRLRDRNKPIKLFSETLEASEAPRSKTPDIELTPTAATPDQRLTITNRGSYGEFFAKARVLEVRNDPNPHSVPTSPFVLRWVDHDRRETEIGKDDSDSLLIGNHELWFNQNLGQINLFELGRPLDRPVWTCRWNMPTEKLPECDIEIKIFQKRLDRPKVKRFTFRPSSYTGGIEMIPLAESDLDGSVDGL